MDTVTVNISFPKRLLQTTDTMARQEARSRSELLRAAVTAYVEQRRRWDHLVSFWRSEAKRTGVTPADVARAIAKDRASHR